MQIEVKVPTLPESVADATVLSWHYEVGAVVERDGKLVDIETDKVVLEVAAPQAGWLRQVVRGVGSTVKAGEVLAIFDTDMAARNTGEAPPKGMAAPRPGATPPSVAKPAPKPNRPGSLPGPAARRLLAEHGLETNQLAGSGLGGRVTKGDVLAHLATPPPPPPVVVPPSVPVMVSVPSVEKGEPFPFQASEETNATTPRPLQRVPMTRLRKRIAERLVEAQHNAAILTTFNEVNMKAVMDLRQRHKDSFEKIHGLRLGFMGFFVKAAVHALKRFPVLNASVEGDDIVYHSYFDIGIAVASPRGLVVPVVRDCEQLSVADVEKGIAQLAKKAREGGLSLEDLSGGTFSITNGGVFGSLMSTPILNAPQSAILGMHKTQDRPVAENGQVVIRPMMYLALSYDHRIIDGAEAVQFLVAVKEAIEDPARLLLEV